MRPSITTKRCNGCREIKEITEFRKAKNNTDGLDSRCKSCKAVYDKSRTEQHSASCRAYYQTHREHIIEKSRARYKANHEKILDINRRSRALKRERPETIINKFYVYPDRSGKWRWRAVSRNGCTVAVSGQSCASKSDAKKAASTFMFRTWAMINADHNTVYEAKS